VPYLSALFDLQAETICFEFVIQMIVC